MTRSARAISGPEVSRSKVSVSKLLQTKASSCKIQAAKQDNEAALQNKENAVPSSKPRAQATNRDTYTAMQNKENMTPKGNGNASIAKTCERQPPRRLPLADLAQTCDLLAQLGEHMLHALPKTSIFEDLSPTPPRQSLSDLPHVDLQEAGVSVKNTFIQVRAASPAGRAATSKISVDTEPKDFAPESFSLVALQEGCAVEVCQTLPEAENVCHSLQVHLPAGCRAQVKNTFIDLHTASPRARAVTSILFGDTEPKNFAPVTRQHRMACCTPEAKNTFLEFKTASPSPYGLQSFWPDTQAPEEKATVISLERSLASSRPQASASAISLERSLGLLIEALWIPPNDSVSENAAVSEPPRAVRLSEHLFSVSPCPVPAADSHPVVDVGEQHSDLVCRCLF